jgi:hypothetical protein
MSLNHPKKLCHPYNIADRAVLVYSFAGYFLLQILQTCFAFLAYQ